MAGLFFLLTAISSCMQPKTWEAEIFETSESGNKLAKISEFPAIEDQARLTILPESASRRSLASAALLPKLRLTCSIS
jgi:hypothetical protein